MSLFKISLEKEKNNVAVIVTPRKLTKKINIKYGFLGIECVENHEIENIISLLINNTISNTSVTVSNSDGILIEKVKVNLINSLKIEKSFQQIYNELVKKSVTKNLYISKRVCKQFLQNSTDVYLLYKEKKKLNNNFLIAKNLNNISSQSFKDELLLEKQINNLMNVNLNPTQKDILIKNKNVLLRLLEQINNTSSHFDIWKKLNTKETYKTIVHREKLKYLYKTLCEFINDNYEFHNIENFDVTKEHELYSGFLDNISSQCGSHLSTENNENMAVCVGINKSSFYISFPLTFSPMYVADNFETTIYYLFFGHPKLWLIIPREETQKLISEFFNYCKLNENYREEICTQPLLHRKFFLTPKWLETRKINFEIVLQKVNTCLIIRENIYHQEINIGLNFSESVNYGSNFRLTSIIGNQCSCSPTNRDFQMFEETSTIHGFRFVNNNILKTNVCHICQKNIMGSSLNLKKHIRIEHSTLSLYNTFQCDRNRCTFKASSLEEINLHVKQHNIIIKCFICKREVYYIIKHLHRFHNLKMIPRHYERNLYFLSKFKNLENKNFSNEDIVKLMGMFYYYYYYY
ncbi:JmJC domain protein [Leptopilina boulardi filamentous virus]|uniref:JmJC domain protein n=1 Tax=Leptopilina boulardi filamentous virus TaxID=552509 RepID=A0A1S5YD25_9VIRU|nr:JmJC domain protein [Leptopilina boulardi filamentous virus]AQQ79933.1 JmJC domain protein [Leptopilina boulardi filamentous virus]